MMMRILAGALVLAVAGTAMAQPQASPEREQRAAAMFDRMDANRDGMISRPEWVQARATMAAERGKGGKGGWGRLDADGDGRLTAEEWQAAGRPAERFQQMDGDGDGVLTREEMMAARKAYQAARAPQAQ